MSYDFYLDAAACSGCKACQVACQDKHALPAGVRWRRVYEVSGGGWERRDGAWAHNAYAYNLAISCNHCERPICVEVCPTNAMHRRADGLVLIDERKCVGCRYCEWACPYGAPRYDARVGVMTKCTGCVDELELGKAPACAAACGLRVLDFGEVAELAARYGGSSERLVPVSPPLPEPALTEPGLLIAAHRHAGRAVTDARVANLEEVRSNASTRYEASLVAFTLLTQLAVGLFWTWVALRWAAPGAADPTGGLPLLAVGPLVVAGMLASLLHLGRPGRAWRALANLLSSWLSREVLLVLTFAVGWAVVLALEIDGRAAAGVRAALAVGVALVGLALIYAMARVYRLRTVPAWDSVRVFRGFLLTALVLGGVGAGTLLAVFGGEMVRAGMLGGLFVVAAGVAILLRARFYHARGRSGMQVSPFAG